MTKREMAEIITESPAWDGCSGEELVKNYTKEQIKDLYDMLDEAEGEYYS